MTSPCLVFRLGLLDYQAGLRLQKSLAAARRSGDFPDALLLLEHPPVFTIGASGSPDHILVGQELLSQQGIEVIPADRGGGITYHGPGQLVAYPVLKLSDLGLGLPEYVRSLEEVVRRTLSHFSIAASHLPSLPGVWVGGEKICAIGLRISGGVSYHGFALNVNNDLLPFSFIHPCGLRDKGVTSLSRLLGRDIPVEAVVAPLLKHFSTVFGVGLEEAPPERAQNIMSNARRLSCRS